MARKKKHAEHENHERWLVSYADLLTLLFALFVVLYAFASTKTAQSKLMIQGLIQSFADMGYITPSAGNTVMVAGQSVLASGDSSTEVGIPASKPSLLVQAPTQGGGGVMDVGASPTVPQTSQQKKGDEQSASASNPQQTSIVAQTGNNSSGAPFDKLKQELRTALQQSVATGTISFSETEDWLTIRVNSDLFFPEGSATLLKRSLPVIDAVAQIIQPMNNYVRIRGYTDNSPTIPELYASNWELSAKRAEVVLNRLITKGITPERMALEAYGEYSPFYSNKTEEGRKQNRRVEIAISRYVRDVKPLEILAEPEQTQENGKQQKTQPEVNPDQLKVIQLPDGRFRVENK